MLLRGGRREVDVVVVEPLVLGAVMGGDGVDGAILSSAPVTTMIQV